MKLLIRHKQIYFFFLTLHVLFLSMPVSHAGEIVLCYSDTGHIKIELKLSEECSSCNKPGDDSQEKDPCFCLDIPLSKEGYRHTTLLKSGTVQGKPQICLQSHIINLLNPSFQDEFCALVNITHFISPIQKSLRATVLLICSFLFLSYSKSFFKPRTVLHSSGML